MTDRPPPPPPPPPDKSSLAELGEATEQVGRSITKLVLWGALFLIALVVLIGVIAGDGDSDENAATPPPTTEATTDAPDTTVATTTAPADPAPIAAVLDAFGACLAASGMDLDGATVAPYDSDVPADRGADPVLVTFPNGAAFIVQTADPELSPQRFGPRPQNPRADAALDLGLINEPDCL